MISRVLENFRSGVGKVKWFSGFFAGRLKVEIAIFKLMYRSSEMNRAREEMLRKIGERVVEFSGHPEKQIMKDSTVVEALAEIGRIDKEIGDCRQKAAELGKVSD